MKQCETIGQPFQTFYSNSEWRPVSFVEWKGKPQGHPSAHLHILM